MERYTDSVLPLEATRFLMPFQSASTVSECKKELSRRLLEQGTAVDVSSIQLYLGKKDGPLLDDDDLLEHVVLDASKEEIFAILLSVRSGSTASMTAASQAVSQVRQTLSLHQVVPNTSQHCSLTRIRQLNISSNEHLEADESGFRIRVITPRLAKQHKDISTISLLPGLFSCTSTLRTIRTRAAQHLGVSKDEALEDRVGDDKECNCSFAKSLVDKTHFKINSKEDDQAATGTPFLVIHSKGVVEQLRARGGDDQSSLFSQVSDTLDTRFGSQWTYSRRMELFNENRRIGLFMSNLVPIVAVCSKSRHVSIQPAAAGNVDDDTSTTDAQSNAHANFCSMQLTVDLHTAEAPIATTRLDLTIRQLGLEETIVNGVLNLFAVIRQVSTEDTVRPKGKDGIYLAGPAWELPVKQSERGTAMFLSSLRVFCHFFGSSIADDRLRDSVLHVFHALSAFPPAVRTLHILLDDKTPSLSECAAFAQSCYETVHEMVPPRLIGSNNGRIFEGACLFFGYLAGRARLSDCLPKTETCFRI